MSLMLLGSTVIKGVAAALLILLLPVVSISYYLIRRRKSEVQNERRLTTLGMSDQYAEFVEGGKGFGLHLALSVSLFSAVVALGASVLFFMKDFGGSEDGSFPRAGSRVVIGMAFLGSYLWGVQYILRRYFMNDLIPGLFYRICLRMFLATSVAFVAANASQAFTSGNGETPIDATVWPVVALLIGMFPQRGLKVLMERLPLFAPKLDPSVRVLPLEMIEGVSLFDRMRLEELGIDDCHDLASEDFVPLFIRTPYSARKLINWVLQAKLCIHVGASMGSLREHGILRITDLEGVSDEELADIAERTPLTLESLRRAKRAVTSDQEIARLVHAAFLLGQFTDEESGVGASKSKAK